MFTRRILFAVLATLLLPFLAATTGHATEVPPEVVLRKLYLAIDRGDLETANQLYASDPLNKEESLIADTAELIKSNGGIARFDVLKVGPVSEDSGDIFSRSKVDYQVRFKNGQRTARLGSSLSRYMDDFGNWGRWGVSGANYKGDEN